MNLHEIIAEALDILHLGSGASFVEPYTGEFRKYANDAVIEISRKFRQTRTETVTLDNNFEFSIADLSHMCLMVVEVLDAYGRPVRWHQTHVGSGVVHVYLPIAVRETTDPNETVHVVYQFRPARLVNPEDVPELPEFAHDCIPYFIAAQHHFSQGGDNAGMGNYFMNQFQNMLQNMPFPYYGDKRAKKLHNYNEGLL